MAEYRAELKIKLADTWSMNFRWDDNTIVDYVGKSFTATFNELVTSWTKANPGQKDKMFNHFKVQFHLYMCFNK